MARRSLTRRGRSSVSSRPPTGRRGREPQAARRLVHARGPRRHDGRPRRDRPSSSPAVGDSASRCGCSIRRAVTDGSSPPSLRGRRARGAVCARRIRHRSGGGRRRPLERARSAHRARRRAPARLRRRAVRPRDRQPALPVADGGGDDAGRHERSQRRPVRRRGGGVPGARRRARRRGRRPRRVRPAPVDPRRPRRPTTSGPSFDERAELFWSWWTGRRIFDAQVHTCALAFQFGPTSTFASRFR